MMSCPKISFKVAYRFIGAIMQHRFVVVEHISANVWPNKLTECSFPGNFNLIIGKPSNKILTLMLFFYIVVIKYKSRFCLKKN